MSKNRLQIQKRQGLNTLSEALTQLHNRVIDLEVENQRLKNELRSLKTGYERAFEDAFQYHNSLFEKDGLPVFDTIEKIAVILAKVEVIAGLSLYADYRVITVLRLMCAQLEDNLSACFAELSRKIERANSTTPDELTHDISTCMARLQSFANGDITGDDGAALREWSAKQGNTSVSLISIIKTLDFGGRRPERARDWIGYELLKLKDSGAASTWSDAIRLLYRRLTHSENNLTDIEKEALKALDYQDAVDKGFRNGGRISADLTNYARKAGNDWRNRH